MLVPSVDVEEDLLGALEEFRNLPRDCDFAGGGEVVVVVEAAADGGGPERNLPRRGGCGAVAFSAIVKAWLLVEILCTQEIDMEYCLLTNGAE